MALLLAVAACDSGGIGELALRYPGKVALPFAADDGGSYTILDNPVAGHLLINRAPLHEMPKPALEAVAVEWLASTGRMCEPTRSGSTVTTGYLEVFYVCS